MSKLKRIVLVYTITWIILIIFSQVLKYFNIFFLYSNIEDILNLITVFGWVIPFLAFIYIKKFELKAALYALYTIIVVFLSPYILIISTIVVTTVSNDNGLQRIYYHQIEHDKALTVFFNNDSFPTSSPGPMLAKQSILV